MQAITPGDSQDSLLVNPYLIALICGIGFAPLSFIVSAMSPLSRSLRHLNSWLWDQLTIILILFPYKEKSLFGKCYQKEASYFEKAICR